MKQFIKNNELQLLNGGYLSNASESPVTNAAFVQAQKSAEYVVTFAAIAKTKTLKDVKADSVESIRAEVEASLKKKDIKFLETTKVSEGKLTSQLKEEALAFMSGAENNAKTEKINAFLQQFEILKDFEEYGLFFEDGIVKLNKIYTLKEVIEAVKSTIDLLP